MSNPVEGPVDECVVRKSVVVKAPVERAFSVFVEQMETWWPATHHIGKTPFEAIFVEPMVGGRWYERDVDGKQVDWGKVLAWDPPHRVTWDRGTTHRTGCAIRTRRRRARWRFALRLRGSRRRLWC
jgi:hypothetical protein